VSVESKHLQGFKGAKLQAGEAVLHSVEGFVQDSTAFAGELILTDRRICFYRKGMVGETFETIGLDKISSVEAKSTLGFRKLEIHTSHDKMEFKVAGSKVAFDALYSRLEELRHRPPSMTAPTVGVSLADELTKLAGLRDAGVLTPAEFEMQKTKLLS
jgi:hypothetical protein